MSVVLTGCPQPAPKVARQCLSGDYCMCAVYARAKARCIEKGEGWRWGITPSPGAVPAP